MSTYRKDRNIILITLDGTSGDYRFDINSGILYGIKGTPLKICPHKSTVTNLFWREGNRRTNVDYLLHHMFTHCKHTPEYIRYVSALMAADKIDALNMPLLHLRLDQYIYVGDHLKLLVNYMRETENFSFSDFQEWCTFEEVRESLGANANLITPKMYAKVKNLLPNLTPKELDTCLYYLSRGKYWEYHGGDLTYLCQYFGYCEDMGKEPVKTNNFMREFCETREAYYLYRTECDNKKIAMNYAKHSHAWEFECGNFVVSIPTCGQDLVTEGQRMHHCVGRYVDRIVDNDTYICFIRHKDTPDTPYITCQVDTEGDIGQYYLAYDQYITSDEDIAFREAFANHLREVWEMG